MRVFWAGLIAIAVMQAFFVGASASEINFGSDVDKREIELSPGQTGFFEFMLINTGANPIVVDIETEDSGPIKVSAVPSEIVLDTGMSTAERWYLLDDGVTHVPIFYAKVYAEAPQKIAPSEFKDQVIRVRVKAALEDAYMGDGIKENLVQAHDYELTVKLSDEFYSRLEAPEEKIDLSFDKNSKTEKMAGTTEKKQNLDESVEYMNMSGAIKIDLSQKTTGKVLEIEKKDDGRGTLIVTILCMAAIAVAILM